MPIEVTTATAITPSHMRTRRFLADRQTSLAMDDIVGNPKKHLVSNSLSGRDRTCTAVDDARFGHGDRHAPASVNRKLIMDQDPSGV
jgi:hypothetical protein